MPVEAVPTLFARHWLWGRVMGSKARELIAADDAKSMASSSAKLEDAGSESDN